MAAKVLSSVSVWRTLTVKSNLRPGPDGPMTGRICRARELEFLRPAGLVLYEHDAGLIADRGADCPYQLAEQVGGLLQHLVGSAEGLCVHLVAALRRDELCELGTDVDVRTFQRAALH